MTATTLLETESMSIVDYRCSARPGDAPFVEAHATYTLAYVRRGSFGARSRGAHHELVPGSLFVGHPGDEYTCVHEHHACGDECLSFQLSPSLADSLGAGPGTWRIGALPPVAEVVVLGELAQASSTGDGDVALDEAGVLLAARFVSVVGGVRASARPLAERDRRRSVDAARWIEDHADQPLTLSRVAKQAGLSEFHFLRLFRAAIGVTPHQFVVRCRLRRAAKLLADIDKPVTDVALEAGFGDLANFIRTFTRAARMSPRAFRRLARNDREVLSKRLARR